MRETSDWPDPPFSAPVTQIHTVLIVGSYCTWKNEFKHILQDGVQYGDSLLSFEILFSIKC